MEYNKNFTLIIPPGSYTPNSLMFRGNIPIIQNYIPSLMPSLVTFPQQQIDSRLMPLYSTRFNLLPMFKNRSYD